jgi:hypothetical protein
MNAEEKNADLEKALSQALEEIQRLQEQVRALLLVHQQWQESQTQLQKVRGELQQTQGQLKESQEQLQKAHERIAELEKQKTTPPAFNGVHSCSFLSMIQEDHFCVTFIPIVGYLFDKQYDRYWE